MYKPQMKLFTVYNAYKNTSKFVPYTLCHLLYCLTIIPFSTAINANYTVCSHTLYSCGSIKNIGYPFWGADRPEFCGHPHFNLICHDTDSTTHLYIPSLGTTTVHNISTSSHKMIISLDRFSYDQPRCHPRNQTPNHKPGLPPVFTFGPRFEKLTLFYGCNNISITQHQSRFVGCADPDNGRNGSISYFQNMSEVFKQETAKSCRNFSVPVLKRDLEELNNGSETLLSILRKSFELEFYAVNLTGCSACQSSGGTCGSSDDTPSSSSSGSKFVCYCPDGPQPLKCPQEKPKLTLILGLGIPSGAAILIVAVALFWYRKRLKSGWKRSVSMEASLDRSTSDVEKGTLYFGVPVFSYTELKEATDSFHDSRELGDGGFGTVYYGILKDGREVAVKRLYEKSYKRVEQFMNEVRILTCLKHQNLVSLYGCTSTHSNELLLVYEYVPNGTVADHLYGDKANNKPDPLPWHVRINIAVETASALAYLHASDIIHRDVKTNNILLDNNFNVKVADFGLSRLFPNDVTHVSTAPQGTPGYLDPEYHQCYQLTDKSDVYSFGVVLIELISSLPAVDMERHRHEINLSNYAMSRIQRCAFDELVDPRLGFESDFNVRRMTTAVAELAFQCLQHDKEFRPSMDDVLETLRRIQSSNYEEGDKNEESKKYTFPPASPSSEKDDIKLLTRHGHHQQHEPPSPDSVMDKWGSRLTTPSSSK